VRSNTIIRFIITALGLLSAFVGFLTLDAPYKQILTIVSTLLLLLALVLYLDTYLGLKNSITNLRTFKRLGIDKIFERGDKTDNLKYYWANSKSIKNINGSA
jgi:hypothetical protein